MFILVCISLFVLLLTAILAAGYHLYVKPSQFVDTLQRLSSEGSRVPLVAGPRSGRRSSLLATVGSLIPSSPKETALLKRELEAAGFRSDSAPGNFNGLKVVLCGFGLVSGFFLRDLSPNPLLHLIIPVSAMLGGYLVPAFTLDRLTSRRQKQIRLALADALDLLVVCTEAGCALDQAIQHVSREFRIVHPALSEEFGQINFELLAGGSRSTALRNFADRTGEEDVKKFVSILIQTDRFGTSVADALRTQADYMRVRRQQAAEERAGKVGTKLVFPIFFFCMPSLVILVAGPSLLQVFTNFLPALGAGK